MGTRWIMTATGEPLQREALAPPEPGPGEALVTVAGCGVCHTDLGFYYDGVRPRHDLPLVLGHEISGHVSAVGDGVTMDPGQAVIVPAVMPCGECDACRAGRGPICPQQKMPGNDIHGGFASHVLVPAAGLCPAPEAGPDGTLGRSGCTLAEISVMADAVTTPYQAIRRAGVSEGDLVVVVGLGGVGGYCLQIARALGASVAAVDIDPERLEAHGSREGVLLLDASGQAPRDLRKQVSAFAKQRGAPRTQWKIFECSGHPGGQEIAWGMLVHGAHLSVVGFTRERISVRLANLMAFDATAQGNWGCVPELYPEVLDLILDGKVQLRPHVQTFPLGEIQHVFEQVHAGQQKRRPVLIPEQEIPS